MTINDTACQFRCWEMPKGGMAKGETPEKAGLSELMEEVGTDKAEIVGEMQDWVTYDLPPHLVGIAFRGKYKGQRQKWFALRFTGMDLKRDSDGTLRFLELNGSPMFLCFDARAGTDIAGCLAARLVSWLPGPSRATAQMRAEAAEPLCAQSVVA